MQFAHNEVIIEKAAGGYILKRDPHIFGVPSIWVCTTIREVLIKVMECFGEEGAVTIERVG